MVEAGSFNMTRSAASRNSENVRVINDVPEVAKTYLDFESLEVLNTFP